MQKLSFSRFLNTKIKCAGLGEVLFDVFETGPKIGGAPANFAYHCRQNGLEAMIISSVGNDRLGFHARHLLANRFLPALLLENDKETGAVNVALNSEGVPTYTFVDDTAYDNIPYTIELEEIVDKLDMICFGSLAQRNALSHETIMKVLDSVHEGAIRVFDVNLRCNYYSAKIIDESLKRTEIFKCNEDELPILVKLLDIKAKTPEEFFEYLKTRNIYCFVYTEGSVQSTVFLNEKISTLKTPKVKVVDTVGAGDSFTATLVSQLMQGESLAVAHQKAVDLAAYVCSMEGAMPDIPQKYL